MQFQLQTVHLPKDAFYEALVLLITQSLKPWNSNLTSKFLHYLLLHTLLMTLMGKEIAVSQSILSMTPKAFTS